MTTGNYWSLISWEYHYPPTVGQVFVGLLQVFFCKFGATFVVAVNSVEGIGVNDGG